MLNCFEIACFFYVSLMDRTSARYRNVAMDIINVFTYQQIPLLIEGIHLGHPGNIALTRTHIKRSYSILATLSGTIKSSTVLETFDNTVGKELWKVLLV